MQNPIYNEIQTTPPQKKKESKGLTVFKALATLVLAVLLFFAAQFVVTFAYMIIEVVKAVLAVGVDLTLLDTTSAEFLSIVESVSNKTLENSLLISLISNLLVLLVLCLVHTIRRKSVFDGLNIRSTNPIRYISFALFGMALQVFIQIILAFLPISQLIEDHNAQYDFLMNDNLFLEVLSSGLVTGIVEELIFRGVGTKQLKKFMHPALAVAISALIFGLVHPSLLSMIYATVLGLILGALYVKYDSVVPSIICHVFFNTTSSLLGRISENNAFLILIFFGISIPLLIYLTKSIFFKYPTASDLLFDSKGNIKPRNSAEAEVINEMNHLKASGSISESDLINIEKSWETAKKSKPETTVEIKPTEEPAPTEENENKGESNTDETL